MLAAPDALSLPTFAVLNKRQFVPDGAVRIELRFMRGKKGKKGYQSGLFSFSVTECLFCLSAFVVKTTVVRMKILTLRLHTYSVCDFTEREKDGQ